MGCAGLRGSCSLAGSPNSISQPERQKIHALPPGTQHVSEGVWAEGI